MAKPRVEWRCQQCGHAAPKWFGRCPECGEYGTFAEHSLDVGAVSSGGSRAAARVPIALDRVTASVAQRTPTGVAELDRVLGGGLVLGSLVLLAGEPGIGKSTLLLQAAASLGALGTSVLYVCGEESAEQVKLRADRLGAGGGISLLPETDIAVVQSTALVEQPGLLIIDSIQAMVDQGLPGVPGSVGQVRACTQRLMDVAKRSGITTLVVGHVTKDGAIAGPRVLEHMVDTVLSFEGDHDHALRIVRAVKNRFGAVSEIGIFEMAEEGLRGAAQPSGVLLSTRDRSVAGSCVMAAVEGSRPLLVEVQALVTPSYLQMPRRLATGVDTARVLQVLAVLERRAGISFGQHDVYVSVAGGVRISEPGIDLPLALALASARSDRPVAADAVAFGELGLTGEIRGVPRSAQRLAEADRLGFGTAYLASGNVDVPVGMDARRRQRVADVLSDAEVMG